MFLLGAGSRTCGRAVFPRARRTSDRSGTDEALSAGLKERGPFHSPNSRFLDFFTYFFFHLSQASPDGWSKGAGKGEKRRKGGIGSEPPVNRP